MKTKELKEIYKKLFVYKWNRSQWARGVNEYAKELLEYLEEYEEETNPELLQKQLLNGATTWHEYSWGGNSLIYDEDIANRLATKSEIKRCTLKNGHLNNWANAVEQWLDVQARALNQAYKRINKVLVTYTNN